MADNRSLNQIESDHNAGHPRMTMYDMKVIETEDYEIILMVCDQCPHIETTYCMHKKNVWNKEETKLTCTLCGIDGT